MRHFMKTRLILQFLFIFNIFFVDAQVFKLIDEIDGKPVKYANIKSVNNDSGTSSDSLGLFTFSSNDSIIINAVGYQNKIVYLRNSTSNIKLSVKEIEIPEVVLHKRKNQSEIIIDKIEQINVDQYYGLSNATTSWIIGNYFKNKSYKTKFLKNISVVTFSNTKNALFNVRLYSVDKNKRPSEELYSQNIIGIAKKGRHKTKVDLSTANIQIPDDGIFIAIDWIKIDKNLYEYNYHMANSEEKLKGKAYSPSFGAISSVDKEKTLIYRENFWNSAVKTIKKNENYAILLMELTLTD